VQSATRTADAPSANATMPVQRTPLASHFADEGDDDPKPASKPPTNAGAGTVEMGEKEEGKVKKKVSRKTGAKSSSVAKSKAEVADTEPLVRVGDIPLDESDKKKATADLRDLQLLEPTDSSATWEAAFARPVSDETSASFAKLLGFARQLNAGVIPFAEFVLIGFVGAGKSTLLEVLLGQPLNLVSVGATKRPVFFQWINNRTVKSLRVTVKRDPLVAEFDRDVEVQLAGLENEIVSRMKVDSTSPVIVTLEAHDTLNFTVIDTPGLGQSGLLDTVVILGVVVVFASVV
jgi:hypothetical protein